MGMVLPIDEIPNEKFKEELRQLEQKNSNDNVPYQQVPAQQDIDYPIYFFTIRKPFPSKEGTTYYSSNKQKLIIDLNKILRDYFETYKEKGDMNKTHYLHTTQQVGRSICRVIQFYRLGSLSQQFMKLRKESLFLLMKSSQKLALTTIR
jgi:hypothetical protein